MANMSYCRFENTLSALRDCCDAIHKDDNDLSESEARAREQLIDLCVTVVLEAMNKVDLKELVDKENLSIALQEFSP